MTHQNEKSVGSNTVGHRFIENDGRGYCHQETQRLVRHTRAVAMQCQRIRFSQTVRRISGSRIISSNQEQCLSLTWPSGYLGKNRCQGQLCLYPVCRAGRYRGCDYREVLRVWWRGSVEVSRGARISWGLCCRGSRCVPIVLAPFEPFTTTGSRLYFCLVI